MLEKSQGNRFLKHELTFWNVQEPNDPVCGKISNRLNIWKSKVYVNWFLIFIVLCKPGNSSSVIAWPFNNENVLAIHLECLHNVTLTKSARRKKNSKKSKNIKPTDFLTKYWDVKLWEKIISSENDCTAGLDERTC